MKTLSLLTSAALLTFTSLSAVETDPVGYVTETIKSGMFNVIGANLASPVIAVGVLEGSTANSVTDDEGTFTANLSESGEYVLKLTNGTGSLGINTTVSASSDDVLVTGNDISSYIVNGTTSYEIRKSLTIADVFGAENSAELQGALAGDTSNSTIIWVPDGLGGYDKVYYNATPRTGLGALSVGWKSTATGDQDASETPVYFTAGMLIQVKRSVFGSNEQGVDASDLNSKKIVLSGSVITTDTQTAVLTGFNYLSRIFPSDMTLGESGLQAYIEQADKGDLTNADLIWVANGSGGYDKYYYNGVERTGLGALSVGWKSTNTGNTDVSSDTLASAFIIQRKGETTMLTIPTLL
ncbi:hypothetical protein ACWPKS_13855 [Coraliomargarita sp. W4R72]